MNTFFASELLILFLLLSVVLRPIFKKENKVDTLVMLIPAAFLLCLLLILTAGLSLNVIVVTIPTLFITLSNINAISRVLSNLKVDVYAPFTLFLSMTGLVLIACAISFIIIFNPCIEIPSLDKILPSLEKIEKPSPKIQKKFFNLQGNLENGFNEKTNFYDKTDACFSIFYPSNIEETINTQPIVIFLPDVYANMEENRATIEAIAFHDNIVISADFFTSDGRYLDNFKNLKICRSFFLRLMYYRNPEKVSLLSKKWISIKEKELNTLISFCHKEFPNSTIKCIAADGNSIKAVQNYQKKLNNPNDNQIPLFEINESIPGYVPGMGNIAIYQRASYALLSPIITNGKIQAKQIALRLEKQK